jgi:hypothetical protein
MLRTFDDHPDARVVDAMVRALKEVRRLPDQSHDRRIRG